MFSRVGTDSSIGTLSTPNTPMARTPSTTRNHLSKSSNVRPPKIGPIGMLEAFIQRIGQVTNRMERDCH